MDVLLMVDPANKETVSEMIQAIDVGLISGAPESREYMDAQSLVAFVINAAQHPEAVYLVVGALLGKLIKVHIEVGGIPLTAKTLKQGVRLIRDLKKLLNDGQDAP